MVIKSGILFFLICFSIFSMENYPKELDLKDIPITDLFAHLSKYSKYTLIGDSYIKDITVDVFFKKGTSIEEILVTVEKTYGLTRVKSGNTFIFRGRKSEDKDMLVGKVYDINTNREVKGVTVLLKRREALEAISGEYGEYLLDSLSRGTYFISILSNDYVYEGDFLDIKEGINRFDFYIEKKNYKSVKNIVEEREQKIKKDDIIEHILLENLNHKEIEKILKETFDEKLKVSTSPGNNSIIIFGNGEAVYTAKKLINQLDKRKKQVRVTAEIIDVKENLFEDLGFNWAYDSQGRLSDKNSGVYLQTLVSTGVDGVGEIMGSSINFVSKFNSGKDVLDLTLNLLETTQDLTVNALPSIILLNGETGTLKMTEEVIVGEDKEENTNNDTINYKPIFKEAGIILKVLPSIKEDNSVYLDLDLEASDFKLKKSLKPNDENSGTFNSEGGSKISRQLQTKVRIKNNDVILIGGLKRKIDQKINSKVPFLGDIPAVGVLFKSRSSRLEHTDLYIKLKAEVIEEI
ncbi:MULTISPECIES: type II secretion system protein GspD [unclassified Cetobacterium]|uniref:type II secretion system protein GspD n=1 Tax=unclassified Cetobacterium TaxID=2630983 RepID=UPI000691E526|nr:MULTISPECIES: secretin N-terminal domain-containing protein [unclassified Cetobacterium]